MSFQRPAGYAGDLSVEDAYAVLSKDEKSVLVDVRTQPEWTYVGVPDLGALGKATIFQEWKSIRRCRWRPISPLVSSRR